MKIRFLQKSDMSQLAYLYEQFWNEKSDIIKMQQQFDILEKENSHILLGAEENNILIG